MNDDAGKHVTQLRSAVITGGSGFVGRALTERLREAATDVVGIDLATDKARNVVAGDISEPGNWQQAGPGADAFIHTAAVVSNTASRDLAWRMNVVGTRNAIDAAIQGGAGRFVHFSSVRAFGDLGFPDGVEESHPVHPDGNTYVDSKIASEQVVLAAHAAGEIDCTIIRPGDVYGPGSRPWTVLPVEAIRSGRFALPAMGRGIFSPTYITNLVDGTLLAATSDHAAGQIFTITDGIGVTCREFFGHYHRMLGRGEPRVLPTGPTLGLAAVNSVANRIAGRNTELNPTTVRYFTRPGTYSIAKARRMLGYEPAVGLAEGMDLTEAWLRSEGLL